MVLRISGIGPFQTPKLLGYISGRLTGDRRSHHNSSQTVVEGLREADGIFSDTSEETWFIERDEGQ